MIKQIGKRYPHFTHEAAIKLAQLLRSYYQSLKDLPIPIPNEFECWVDEEIVCYLTNHCGEPLGPLAETHSAPQISHLTASIMIIISKLFQASTPSTTNKTVGTSWLTLSMDISPNNFTLDNTQTVRYIDFTPPLLKLRREDAFPKAFIPTTQLDEHPTWKNFRYFNRKGIILTFLTKFWAAWPQHYEIIHDHLAQFLSQPDQQSVLSYLRTCAAIHIYRLVQEGRIALFASQNAHVERCRADLQHLIFHIVEAERDQLRLSILLLAPTHLGHIDDQLWKYHTQLASAHDNHTQLFQAIFTCYNSSHTHHQLQHLVISLVDLALTSDAQDSFRRIDTPLLALLMQPDQH